jgi:F0F1-type ATP synthase membrane subunit c/vacuolar-type H+-ATPase subunit K
MLIGGIGYAGDSIIQFMLSNSVVLSVIFSSMLVLAVIAEFWFAFWLLIKGMNKESEI